MTQSLTEALAERAEAAVRAGDAERDREAWNLPRGPSEVASSDREQLDWDGFLAAYFPASRRHDLKAIVAYGAYRKSGTVDEQTASRGARLQGADGTWSAATPVAAWEDEGGASR